MIVFTSAIIAANGLSLFSLVATLCMVSYSILHPASSPDGLSSKKNEVKSDTQEPELSVNPIPEPEPASNFQLYRQSELNRIVASLLADSSILVVGEEGSGKSVLANAVIEKLQNDGFTVVSVELASTKQMLRKIAEQIGLDTQSLEGKSLTTDELKRAIAAYLDETTAFIVVDDCNRYPVHFRLWLKQLRKQKVPILLLATNPPRTDVFLNMPPMILHPLPEYAIRKIMEQAALERGINLKNSDLARLQERSGGNPMLAERAIDEEYLGLEVEAGDHRRYADITPLILLVGMIFAVLRFLGMGTNNRALYIFSGIGAVIFIGFSRLFYHLPQENGKIQG